MKTSLGRFVGLALGLFLGLLGVSSCAPQTDLVASGESTAGSTKGRGLAGAVLVDPAPGTDSVPLNLAAVLVRFDNAVTVGDRALEVASGGQRASAGPPVQVACEAGGGGTCLRLPLDGLLSPTATYIVSLGDGVVDEQGRPVPGGPVGQFVTASTPDHAPPLIGGLMVGLSGPCVIVGFETSEPSAAMVVISDGLTERHISAGAGLTTFSVAASLAVFEPAAEVFVVARASDLAGNVAEAAAVAVTVPLGLVPITITEVRANAAGPEPGQEFVEVRNLGKDRVDLTALAIEDSKAADILPTASLEAGAYALIVPSGFDASNGMDVPPRGETALLRVDSRLGSDGLANGGEVVRLRTIDGTVVSSYGGWVDVSATKWAGKSVHRVPEDACDQAASWTRAPTPATPGWSAP